MGHVQLKFLYTVYKDFTCKRAHPPRLKRDASGPADPWPPGDQIMRPREKKHPGPTNEIPIFVILAKGVYSKLPKPDPPSYGRPWRIATTVGSIMGTAEIPPAFVEKDAVERYASTETLSFR